MNWSRLLDFYINNKKEIDDLIELDSRARKMLPKEVAEFVRVSLEQDIESWSGFHDPKCGVERDSADEWYVWWTDKTFHEDGVGPCFDIYLSTSALLRPHEGDNPYIFLEFEGESRSARRKAFEAAIKSTKSKLIGSQWDDSKNIVAHKPLDKIITLAALLRPDDLARDIRKVAKEFSEAFAPICGMQR